MRLLILSIIKLVIVVALGYNYFTSGDLGSLVIACMLIIDSRIDYLKSMIEDLPSS